MSTPASVSVKPRANRSGSVLHDWARTDGLAWIYIFKAVLAALLALWIAMRLDMPQPRTAMTTVFVVMQPQSGMVLAKSFYRFCGTMVGLVVMLVLISLFSQQPVLFLSRRRRCGSASARRARRATAISARTASCSRATRRR